MVAACLLTACASPATGSTIASQPSPAQQSATASPSVSASAASPQAEPVVDCSISKCVAITYDDGPSPRTNQILDAFIAADAVATFFLNGQMASNDPATVRRGFDAGMEIANHTTNHTHLPLGSADQISFEISDTQQRIAAITGVAPTLLRPPYGDRNQLVDQIAGEQGLAVVNWSDGPADWENTDTQTVIDLTLARARPGSILLMHDTHQWTADATPAIIDGLQAQGYELVSVSQIIGTPTPGQFYTSGMAPTQG